MQTAFYILVENADNQGLIKDTFRQSFFLKRPQIPGRKSDVDTDIFLEHRFRVFLMAFLSAKSAAHLSSPASNACRSSCSS